MKRHFPVIALVVVATAIICLYLGCATPQNNNMNTVAMATPEPTPDKTAIEAELTKIENDWPRIIKERDGATVRRIEADDVVIVYPDGSMGNKEQDAKDTEAGLFTFDSWETSDLKVNIVDKDSAVVTLRYTVKNAKIKSPDGKSLDVSGQYLSLDTFARRNGQWQFVGLSTVKVQSPTSSASPTPKASPSVTPKASPSVKPTPVAKPSAAAKPSPLTKPAAKPSPAKAVPSPMKTKTP